MRTAIVASFLLAVASSPADASASTLYKLVDKDGKVTYTQLVPRGFAGEVTPIEIPAYPEPAPLQPQPPKPAMKGDPIATTPGGPSHQIVSEERLRAARQRLEGALAGLEAARNNPGDNDVRFLGNANRKGVRLVPTEEYAARIALLEQAAVTAQAELEALERSR